MSDEKVYTPETIEESPLPENGTGAILTESQQTSNETYSQKTIKPQSVPSKKIAYEIIGSALNTKSKKILQEFALELAGGFSIGKYENGVSGDVRITPNGIVARDLAGLITFALDGTTGDATFKGTIQAGALIAGAVAVGDNSVVLDGEGRRIIINDGENDRIVIGNLVF